MPGLPPESTPMSDGAQKYACMIKSIVLDLTNVARKRDLLKSKQLLSLEAPHSVSDDRRSISSNWEFCGTWYIGTASRSERTCICCRHCSKPLNDRWTNGSKLSKFEYN